MFERFTEKFRRVIFFARYEASQFGSPYIETEHLLLGLLREDHALVHRYQLSPNSLREQIEKAVIVREKTSTSVDLPLSNESKRVLSYAAEEADAHQHKHIGTDHLLVGLLREDKSFAAELLRQSGVRLKDARKSMAGSTGEPGPAVADKFTPEHARANRRDTIIEIMEGEQSLATTVFSSSHLPRIAEEVVLQFADGGSVSYRVEAVRYILDADTEELQKVQVVVKRV